MASSCSRACRPLPCSAARHAETKAVERTGKPALSVSSTSLHPHKPLISGNFPENHPPDCPQAICTQPVGNFTPRDPFMHAAPGNRFKGPARPRRPHLPTTPGDHGPQAIRRPQEALWRPCRGPGICLVFALSAGRWRDGLIPILSPCSAAAITFRDCPCQCWISCS